LVLAVVMLVGSMGCELVALLWKDRRRREARLLLTWYAGLRRWVASWT
jgi:hypothetical protein